MDLLVSPYNTTSPITRALSSCAIRQLLTPGVASRFASTTCRFKPRVGHHIRPHARPTTQPRQRRTLYTTGLAFVTVPACALAVDSTSSKSLSVDGKTTMHSLVDEESRSRAYKSISNNQPQLPYIMRQNYQSQLPDTIPYEAPYSDDSDWIRDRLGGLASWLFKKVLLNVVVDGSIAYWVACMTEKEQEEKDAEEMRWISEEGSPVSPPRKSSRHKIKGDRTSKVEVC